MVVAGGTSGGGDCDTVGEVDAFAEVSTRRHRADGAPGPLKPDLYQGGRVLTSLCLVLRICALWRIGDRGETVNAVLIGQPYAFAVEVRDMRKPMEAQRIAVDAVVALTDCDRDAVTAFIRRLYLAGVKDPKRLTFKGLQAMARP